jgi:hypothetical protein
MATKEPVLLTVLIETAELRWSVAGISLQGEPIPLMQSEAGNLDEYIGVPFDEQTSFLRHRLSGVLQRGCDRLWGRQKKPCHIVFVTDGPFVQATDELTPHVAEHFVQWMASPPVAFFSSDKGFGPAQNLSLSKVAGDLDGPYRDSLDAGLPELLALVGDSSVWEIAPKNVKR